MRLFAHRVADNSTAEHSKWVIWRWFDIIPNGQKEIYLSRLNLLSTPWFGIKIHWIHKPDNDRALHDHPWSFASFVLRGGYEEVIPVVLYQDARWWESTKLRRINWFNFKSSWQAHRITSVKKNTVTLVLNGPKTRTWGFCTAKGWIEWFNYCEA